MKYLLCVLMLTGLVFAKTRTETVKVIHSDTVVTIKCDTIKSVKYDTLKIVKKFVDTSIFLGEDTIKGKK